VQYLGVLKRDNSGLYLQARDRNYRIIMQRMPVDALEKNVIVTGDLEDDTIIAEGVRLDDNFAHPAM
jgi:hypothetical protein